MARKVSDCRKFPSEKNCTLTISGEEDEVLDTAVQHAVSAHGEENTPELREMIRGSLEDEVPVTMPGVSRAEAQVEARH